MQCLVMQIYLAALKLSISESKEPIENCAYCAHPNITIESIEKSLSCNDIISFVLRCGACNKIDRPTAKIDELLKILT